MVLARLWPAALGLLLLVRCASATCFNPDGSEAKNDSPCFPNEANSTCCGVGLACLSNNLCGITQFASDPKSTFGLGEWFVRGSCTEKSFTNPACLNRCLRSASGDLYNVFVPVRQCLTGNKDRWYCSNAQTRGQSLDEVCFAPSKADEYLFQMDGNPSTVTVIGHATAATVAGATVLASATSIASQLGGTTSSSVTGMLWPTNSNTASSGITVQSDAPNYSVPIGLGVGVPFGLLCAGILVFLYLRQRRKAAAARKLLEEKQAPYSQPPIYEYRAELTEWSRAGELSTSADPQELAAGGHRDEEAAARRT